MDILQFYLIYARKSTDDADNQKNSLEYQVEAGLRFAGAENLAVAKDSIPGLMEKGVIREKHSGYKTSDLQLTQDGRVSYEIERPKFQQLVQLLLAGRYCGVIVLCWDRISRNQHDDLVIKRLIDIGVDVRFVQVRYDKTSSGALHRDIDGMFSQHYSRVISEKIRNTFDKFRRDGRCLGKAPIGYLNQGSDNKPFDSERAPLVARCFEMYASGGWSYKQLANWANLQGLTSRPSRKHRTANEIQAGAALSQDKHARPLTGKSIEMMLLNPFYIGQHREPLRGDVRECKHAPLISRSLFYQVRKVAASRTVSVHYVDRAFMTYRGLINCGGCGRTFSPYVQKGHCYYRSRCRSNCANTSPNLSGEQIDKAVADFLGRIGFTADELAEISAGAGSALDRIAEQRTNDLTDLENERKRIYADLDYLKKNKITLLRTGASTVEGFASETVVLEAELDVVQEKMNVYKEVEHEMLDYVLTFSELVGRVSEFYLHGLDGEKRELLTLAITELGFLDGKFQFRPKDGFQALFSRLEPELAVGCGRICEKRGVDYLTSELRNIYLATQRSATALKSTKIPGLSIITMRLA